MNLSVIIPILNEEACITPLIHRMREALGGVTYELIFIDDHSTDNTSKILRVFSSLDPRISVYEKRGEKGKAQSLLEGFEYAKNDILCIIDADLQYPPEAIPSMLTRIEKGIDIIVAFREEQKTSFVRRFISATNRFFFGKLLHGFNSDVQAGLKVFRGDILKRISLSPSPWAFDLEFLVKAREAGYKIENENIIFAKRVNGKAKINVVKASLEIGWSAIKLKFIKPRIIPFSAKMIKQKGEGFHYKGKEFIHHSGLKPNETAFFRLSLGQKIIILEIVAILSLCLLLNWHMTIVSILAILVALYFIDSLFTLFFINYSSERPAEFAISTRETRVEREWPIYSILCPLYKEWRIVPQFIDAMSKLDYPKDKLQVMLLLEEDDLESIHKINDLSLPPYFEIIVVPDSKPKTKPKACNYGLKLSRGEYVVIYDAEDVPDPLQLKKAILIFEKSSSDIACVQAKLNFYNPQQNWLTRAFSAEYSLWFDLILPGLQAINAPILLGGTSNHFRTQTLRLLKGWDSFNVTEDAELGTRLFKKGYKTIVADSVTLEEANSQMRNWFTQRGRWIQGYIQTYFVHMRKPREFWVKGDKKYHFFTYQFIVFGKVVDMSLNFFMWIITFLYFAFRPEVGVFIQSFFPAPVLYMGAFCFLVGNFLYMYYYMIACAKHRHYEIIKYMYLIPIYWALMTFATWRAIYKFITAPHSWAKTKHGLYLDNEQAVTQANTILGYDLAPVVVK